MAIGETSPQFAMRRNPGSILPSSPQGFHTSLGVLMSFPRHSELAAYDRSHVRTQNCENHDASATRPRMIQLSDISNSQLTTLTTSEIQPIPEHG